MMKSKKRFISYVCMTLLLAICTMFFLSCKDPNKENREQVSVTYETNGGKAILKTVVDKGDTIVLPIPSYEGKEFMGWFYDENFNSKTNDRITVELDIILYAKWGVYLNFDTYGGVECTSKLYNIGDKIGALQTTYKDGYIFMGWFYDEKYTNKVYENDVINNKTTIHAYFSNEASGTIKRIESVKNVSSNPSIVLNSKAVLNNSNVNEYVRMENSSGKVIEVMIKPGEINGEYIFEPFESLIPGEIYFIKSLNSSNKFTKVDESQLDEADEVSLTIYREEKQIIEKKETTRVLNSYVMDYQEGVYTFLDNGLEKDVNRLIIKKDINIEFKEGLIITIGKSSEESVEDYICKIIASKIEKMQFVVGDSILEDEFWVLDVVTPNVDDIYDDLDVFCTGKVELEDYIDLSSEEIIDNISKNKGVTRLKNSITSAIPYTPTMEEYMKGFSDEASKEAFLLSLSSFSFNRPIVKISIRGTELAFSIKLSGELKIKNFKLEITIEIENQTSIDYSFSITKSGKVTLNPLLWFYTNLQVNLSNDFSIKINAEVSFGEKDNVNEIKNTVDISNEIKEILGESKEGYNKLSESLTGSPFFDEDGSELDYVDIFNIPLGKIPVPVPIVSFQIDFSVVGSIGAKAGLYIDFSHHYVESTTLTNGEANENGKPSMYKEFKFNRVTTRSEIDLSITLKGQIGFRCGLEAKFSLSVLGFNDVASVYVAFRFGPYIEISGLVSFRYTYDAVKKISATQIQGGIYLEVGLFVNAKLGTHFLKFDINIDLFDHKIALYDVGERLIPLEFEEKENGPDNPYQIFKRYSGVATSKLMMRYIDITTGKKVVDRANNNKYGYSYEYDIEFVDVPDYQTDDYQDYVTLNYGCQTVISRNFMLKSLKFVVRITLKPKQGVLTTGVSRIVYMEYYNEKGRDLIESTQIFANSYDNPLGSKHYEEIQKTNVIEGEYVTPPPLSVYDLPIRQGYYLDIDDLWEKYYPGIGKVDENWDGKFPKITYDNTNRGVLYRLKWKVKTYNLKLYTPIYESSESIKDNELIGEYEMKYVPYLRAFIINTNELIINSYPGKRFIEFRASNGLTLFNNIFSLNNKQGVYKDFGFEDGQYLIMRVDESLNTYINDFKDMEKELCMYATYEDTNTFKETYVLRTDSIERISVTYKPFDYQHKDIRPLPPTEYEIGKTFMWKGNEYIITGYQDLNPSLENIDNCRYINVKDMPNVTKDRIYYVLFERNNYDSIPIHYIYVYANGVLVGSYGVKEGEPINYELVKINISDSVIIGGLVGCPSWKVMDEICESATVTWPDSLPSQMPKNDIKCNVTCEYTLKNHTVKFVIDEKYSFAGDLDITTENGNNVYTVFGRPWVQGANNEDAYYSMPLVNNYFDNYTKKYYVFEGWVNEDGDYYPINVSKAFVKSEIYTPVFTEKEVPVTIQFINYTSYGYEYYYKVIQGNYYGKTLDEVIKNEGIDNPSRLDESNKYTYKFNNWGVNSKEYVIGTENDIDGNVKTTLIFRAYYDEEKATHKITFDAGEGKFANGSNKMVVQGAFDEIIDFSNLIPQDYKNSMGTFVFAFWTERLYSAEHKIDTYNFLIGTEDKTYYAYYNLNPATITLTFKGQVETEKEDGTGVVYFNNNLQETTLTVSQKYGTYYYINASMFAVDSKSKTFKPDYLRWIVNGKEYISEFYNDNYMACIPFDNDATVEIVFKKPVPKNINITFVSGGYCYELSGEKIEDVYCNGYMSGFRTVANLNMEYGSQMEVPSVSYYNSKNYVFSHFEAVKETETGEKIIKKVYPGEIIIFDENCDYYGVYVHDTNKDIIISLYAEEHYSVAEENSEYTSGLHLFKDNSSFKQISGKYGDLINLEFEPACKGMIFIGWTITGKDFISKEDFNAMQFTEKETYYAVYKRDENTKYTVTLNAANGRFDDNSYKKIAEVNYGKLAATLPIPNPDQEELIFSHYEDESGNIITSISESIELFAIYGKQIATLEELQKINDFPNGNYVLTQDIIARSKEELNYIEWNPLGSTSNIGFTGIFNGNGHVIAFNSIVTTDLQYGLFSEINGTVYNLYTNISFWLTGEVKSKAIGSVANKVGQNGKVIDCTFMNSTNLKIKAMQDISVAGIIGENYGTIDGLMAGTNGSIEVENDYSCNIGNIIGTNYGTASNLANTGRIGSLLVSMTRSASCNIGTLAGSNKGIITNSFSERDTAINLSRGDNNYIKNSINVGGLVGINTGTISNCTVYATDLDLSISNITLTKADLMVVITKDNDYKCYQVYEFDKDNQGGLWILQYIVYADENAEKSSSQICPEYLPSEFKQINQVAASKLFSFENVISYEKVCTNSGKVENVNSIDYSAKGNIEEIVANCYFNELKWNYMFGLFENNYAK